MPAYPKSAPVMAGIDTSLFEESADLWKDNETFNNSIEIISSLAVVNDGAERGVKLSREYICTANWRAICRVSCKWSKMNETTSQISERDEVSQSADF